MMTGLFSCFGLKQEYNTEEPVITKISTEEVTPDSVLGYWNSDSQYYMELTEDELILRDSFKNINLQTGYSVENIAGMLIFDLEDTDLTYSPDTPDPYGYISEMFYDEGRIYMYYVHKYYPDETRETVFEATDKGPFDNIIIRDDEYLDELQGKWMESPNSSYVILIEGNHMSIGYEYADGKMDIEDEMDFHVISYDYYPEKVYLIHDDLIDTYFYAFTQFEYSDGKLYSNEMVLDADWDTSVVFSKVEE